MGALNATWSRVPVIAGCVALGAVSVPGGFATIATINGWLYCLSQTLAYLFFAKPPSEPRRFALSLAAIAALFLIGTFIGYRPVRTIGRLISLWCGALIGVILYGVVVIWPWL
jgi:hypothetical protein